MLVCEILALCAKKQTTTTKNYNSSVKCVFSFEWQPYTCKSLEYKVDMDHKGAQKTGLCIKSESGPLVQVGLSATLRECNIVSNSL